MGVFNGAFPVLPGKEDAARAFAAAIAGPKKAEFDAMQTRSKVTRETWALQDTPAGMFNLVWFEGDVDAAFADLTTAQDDFTVWFRAQIEDITGVDMSPSDDGDEPAPPEVVLDWSA